MNTIFRIITILGGITLILLAFYLITLDRPRSDDKTIFILITISMIIVGFSNIMFSIKSDIGKIKNENMKLNLLIEQKELNKKLKNDDESN